MKNLKYVLATLAAVVFTWLLHEFAHWTMGELLGNPMTLTLNSSYPTSGRYADASHYNLVSAAGPMITLLQAFIVYLLLKRKELRWLFPFLLTCLYMRFLAGAMNMINLNDEGRISHSLGLGTYTLPLLVIGILGYLTYATCQTRGYKARLTALTFLLIMVFSSGLILADQAWKLHLL
ncbi:hypothetical protein ACFSC6_18520 [Rufibacter sediminis]|uniref:Peptidase M50 domain-containing protein n=1 Tax=Rufibacter sediminis TaxID=2762756 RepID=A0ABR6VQP0_9BACT|nr:hypothetical protein [Rufibacter sediminis]MBC3539521.1 hypothetical protein [Rufibacter sediminis]